MSEGTQLSIPQTALATLADAEQALKIIAIAETAETLCVRAKDREQLFAAIKAKLTNQAAYAVWRQDVAVPSQSVGKRRKPDGIAEPRSHNLPASDPGKDVIARWRARLCEKITGSKWRIDERKLGTVLEDAALRCVRICEQENMGTIRGTEGTGEFERYTPAEYIAKAREVMGGIDLDPATCEQAQKTVAATTYFTAGDDGLARPWHGRVWLNPPYHRELAPRFIDKLIDEYEAGHIDQAIVLTNNSTDTSWFQSAALICDAICFTDGRIRFEVPNGDPVSPTQGQAFFYFGQDTKRFVDVFESVGVCMGLA